MLPCLLRLNDKSIDEASNDSGGLQSVTHSKLVAEARSGTAKALPTTESNTTLDDPSNPKSRNGPGGIGPGDAGCELTAPLKALSF